MGLSSLKTQLKKYNATETKNNKQLSYTKTTITIIIESKKYAPIAISSNDNKRASESESSAAK